MLSVHIRNFSSVDRDKIQETQLTKLVENYGHQFSNNWKQIFRYSPDLKSLTTAVPSLTIMKIKELREEISPVVSRHTSLLTFTSKIEVLSSDNLAITNYQSHSRINLSRFILNAYFDKNRASTYLTLLGILTLENS